MLSIFDRIEIAVACHKGNRQFKKELRAYDRAAGVNKNNVDDESVSNNTTATTSEKKSNSFFMNLFGGRSENKENTNITPVEPEIKENANSASVEPEIKENTNSASVEPESEVRTEEEIYAEAEAPVEEVGAEIIAGEIVAEQPTEATMSSNTRVNDTNKPGVIDFSQFGFTLDTVAASRGLNGAPTEPFPGQIIPNATPNQMMPIPDQTPEQPLPNPAMQFQMPNMPGMDTYAQMLNQQPGQGRHRVDQPKPVKPPKGPKSEPEHIDISGMPDLQRGMDVEYFPKQDVRKIGVVEDKVPMEVEKVEHKSIFPKNETLFPKYPYLQDIEKIGLENGYQVGFGVRTTGLIECHVCNDNGEDIPNKGFVIDPGFIIDHRKKIFVGMYNFYEGMNAYPLFIPGNDKDGKKGSNILNADLIKGLIVGGNQTVEGVKGLYSEDFRNLNCIVALITIPTNKIGAADRKYIQNRLVTIYKSGVLTDVLSTNPGARFRVADFNKSSNTIILDTEGVPKTFGGQYVSNERIQLKVTADKCKVLRGENIINIADGE